MDLLIVRHAIAFDRNPKRWPDDGERPLSPEGILRARKAAAGLKRIVDPPQRVLASPLVRARQTAAILTDFAGWPKAADCSELAPDESPEAVLRVLRTLPDKLVGIVGHQPGLGRLIATCLAEGTLDADRFELKKFGIASITFRSGPAAGHGVLNWLVPPRVLRAARA